MKTAEEVLKTELSKVEFSSNFMDKHNAILLAMEAYAQQKAQAWISVKDRLPMEDENVLGASKISTGVRNEFEYALLRFYIYNKRGKWYWEDGRDCSNEVTHWMPLPEPPKDY